MGRKLSSRNIIANVKQHAVDNNLPFQVEIDVTYRCNAKCFFCFQGNVHEDSRQVLSFSQLSKVLSDLKKMGCFYIGFSGGEPFLREDFLDTVRCAKKLGFMVSVVTNLQLPSSKDLKTLFKHGVNKVTVSFHSHDVETYCDIFNVSEQEYHQALSNVRYLIANEHPVSIASTVSQKNFMHMAELKSFFEREGLTSSDINFNLLIQGKNDIAEYRDSQEFRDYIAANKGLKDNILEQSIDFMCSAGRISCSITPFGDVVPCTFFNAIAGNVLESSISEIWHNSHLLKILRSFDAQSFSKCNACDYRGYCHVCMANNLNETGRYNIPALDYCSFRKNIAEILLEGN